MGLSVLPIFDIPLMLLLCMIVRLVADNGVPPQLDILLFDGAAVLLVFTGSVCDGPCGLITTKALIVLTIRCVLLTAHESVCESLLAVSCGLGGLSKDPLHGDPTSGLLHRDSGLDVAKILLARSLLASEILTEGRLSNRQIRCGTLIGGRGGLLGLRSHARRGADESGPIQSTIDGSGLLRLNIALRPLVGGTPCLSGIRDSLKECPTLDLDLIGYLSHRRGTVGVGFFLAASIAL